jgi:hypothetical protein
MARAGQRRDSDGREWSSSGHWPPGLSATAARWQRVVGRRATHSLPRALAAALGELLVAQGTVAVDRREQIGRGVGEEGDGGDSPMPGNRRVPAPARFGSGGRRGVMRRRGGFI